MAHQTYCAHKVNSEDRADGTTVMRSGYALGKSAASTNVWLHRWADERPEGVFLAERSGAGWRELQYGVAVEQVRALAAQYVGIPYVPVAEQ